MTDGKYPSRDNPIWRSPHKFKGLCRWHLPGLWGRRSTPQYWWGSSPFETAQYSPGQCNTCITSPMCRKKSVPTPRSEKQEDTKIRPRRDKVQVRLPMVCLRSKESPITKSDLTWATTDSNWSIWYQKRLGSRDPTPECLLPRTLRKHLLHWFDFKHIFAWKADHLVHAGRQRISHKTEQKVKCGNKNTWTCVELWKKRTNLIHEGLPQCVVISRLKAVL